MRVLLIVALLAPGVAVAGRATAQQPAGSQLPLDENRCATCHGEKDLWEGDNLRLFVPLEQITEDVHGKNGVTCHDCHGGDPNTLNFQQAHAVEVDDAQSSVLPFQPLLGQQARTPERLKTLVQVCSKCHQQASESYLVSVHGHGLQQSGLVVTAVCTDCHGHHNIYPASDPRSSLHSTNVCTTCATCHRFIEERLQQSVHGRDRTPPGKTANPKPGEEARRRPNCTDCHQGHDLPHPKSAAFRLGLPDRCGNCHAELSTSYMRSLHGQLTELGYMPAAKCSDCHGSHDILPVSEPASRLSAINRRATCAKCHPDATDNFLDFDPHADPRDFRHNAILYWVNLGLTGLLTTVFVIFGTHSFLWLVRSLPYVAKHGRPKYPRPGDRAYVRFQPVHRIAHAVLVTSFLGLALTGLPLRYGNQGWAQTVSWALGGFASTGLWHRIFGITNLCCLVFYCVLVRRSVDCWAANGRQPDPLHVWPRFSCAESPRPDGFCEDDTLVCRPGAEADLRTLDVLGEIRSVGCLGRHRPDWHHRLDPLVPESILRAAAWTNTEHCRPDPREAGSARHWICLCNPFLQRKLAAGEIPNGH